jgi:hypothetical protein
MTPPREPGRVVAFPQWRRQSEQLRDLALVLLLCLIVMAAWLLAATRMVAIMRDAADLAAAAESARPQADPPGSDSKHGTTS